MSKLRDIGRLAQLLLHKSLWKLGARGIAPRRPTTLMVEPANVCNLRCPACPTGRGMLGRPPRMLKFEEFKRVLDQCLDPPGYLKRVTLFNYGEPFLCPDFLKMVSYAAGKGLETMTSTNGHFFESDEKAEEVVRSGLSELIICLDGANSETLGRYRRNSDFNEIVEGIRRILRAREKAGTSDPVVELQFIIMRHNEHQADDMRRLGRELGVDRLLLKTVGINPADPDFPKLAEELLPEDLSLSRFERKMDGTIALKGYATGPCEYINSTMVVNSNGDVIPCCYDIYSKHVVGNVFEQPVEEVWLGERFRKIRRQVRKDRGWIEMCRQCPEGRGPLRKDEDMRE